jgi:hypothetical protein
MANDDSKRERQRLAETYVGMADGELQGLARDSGSLSEEAWDALEAEFARRKLSPEVELSHESPGEEIPDWNELIILRQFRDLPEALLAKGSLDSAGIESFLVDDNMARMNWFISNVVGGVKLCVRQEDAEAAAEFLQQPPPERIQVEGVGDYEQPSCPNCHSLDISLEALNRPVAYTSAWLGVPIPLKRERWKCNACGHIWKAEKDGDATSEPSPTM